MGYAELARALGLENPQALWQLVKRESKRSDLAPKLAIYFRVPLEDLLSDGFDIDQYHPIQPPSKPSSDAEKLLVLVLTFLDTDGEGRDELVEVAQAIRAESGTAKSTTPRQRIKRR